MCVGGGGRGRGHSLYKGIRGCAAGISYVFTSSGIYLIGSSIQDSMYCFGLSFSSGLYSLRS